MTLEIIAILISILSAIASYYAVQKNKQPAILQFENLLIQMKADKKAQFRLATLEMTTPGKEISSLLKEDISEEDKKYFNEYIVELRAFLEKNKKLKCNILTPGFTNVTSGNTYFKESFNHPAFVHS